MHESLLEGAFLCDKVITMDRLSNLQPNLFRNVLMVNPNNFFLKFNNKTILKDSCLTTRR